MPTIFQKATFFKQNIIFKKTISGQNLDFSMHDLTREGNQKSLLQFPLAENSAPHVRHGIGIRPTTPENNKNRGYDSHTEILEVFILLQMTPKPPKYVH